jgi:hypothetical protein
MIRLDGRLRSSLDWNHQIQEANGKRVEWFCDLGLFDHLSQPLSNNMQFQSFKLSLEHFVEKIWEKFGAKGLYLYDGPLVFPSHLLESPIDDARERALKARDIGADYLNLLTAFLPDDLPLYLRVETTQVSDPFLKQLLLASDPYERIELVQAPEVFSKHAPTALCVPESLNRSLEILEEGFKKMEGLGKPWRPIPEGRLTLEWEGLDELYVLAGTQSPEGKRRVQGFQAAGGRVVEISPSPLRKIQK